MWSYKSFSSTWLIQQAEHESVSALAQKFRVHTARSPSHSALQGLLHCPSCTMVILTVAISEKKKSKMLENLTHYFCIWRFYTKLEKQNHNLTFNLLSFQLYVEKDVCGAIWPFGDWRHTLYWITKYTSNVSLKGNIFLAYSELDSEEEKMTFFFCQ